MKNKNKNKNKIRREKEALVAKTDLPDVSIKWVSKCNLPDMFFRVDVTQCTVDSLWVSVKTQEIIFLQLLGSEDRLNA
jgi:hypothetical protein